MKIYHKIQNTFFQNFDFSHIKENRKIGCDIMHIIAFIQSFVYRRTVGKEKMMDQLLHDIRQQFPWKP